LNKLIASDGAGQDGFGATVAMWRNLLVVGAPGDDDDDSESGSAYVFDVSTGDEIAKLLSDQGHIHAGFGRSVSVENDIVVVGSESGNGPGYMNGAVYIFKASTGEQVGRLAPPQGTSGSGFGDSASIYHSFVAVGSPDADDNGSGSGAAWLFDVYTCELAGQLRPTDGSAGASFGRSISSRDGFIGVGAQRDDAIGNDSGSAYVFSMPEIFTPADVNEDGLVDFFDYQLFLDWWAAEDPRADLIPDQVFDFYDIQVYLDRASPGC
jgi:hypothetical protein